MYLQAYEVFMKNHMPVQEKRLLLTFIRPHKSHKILKYILNNVGEDKSCRLLTACAGGHKRDEINCGIQV